jgi:hypothetical protein
MPQNGVYDSFAIDLRKQAKLLFVEDIHRLHDRFQFS